MLRFCTVVSNLVCDTHSVPGNVWCQISRTRDGIQSSCRTNLWSANSIYIRYGCSDPPNCSKTSKSCSIEAISDNAGFSVSLPVICENVIGPQATKMAAEMTRKKMPFSKVLKRLHIKKEENESRTPSHSSISSTPNSTFEDPFDITV